MNGRLIIINIYDILIEIYIHLFQVYLNVMGLLICSCPCGNEMVSQYLLLKSGLNRQL